MTTRLGLCDCGHEAVFHDARGCFVWEKPPRNDRRRNPRRCTCTTSIREAVNYKPVISFLTHSSRDRD